MKAQRTSFSPGGLLKLSQQTSDRSRHIEETAEAAYERRLEAVKMHFAEEQQNTNERLDAIALRSQQMEASIEKTLAAVLANPR